MTGTDDESSYAIRIRGDQDRGFTITNTHTPRTTDIKVTKVWDDADDQDGIHPVSVEVELYKYIKVGPFDVRVPFGH